MTTEPRSKEDYSPRQTEAAHRVLIDLGQILASFKDCIVIIGGWVPDLLLPNASEPHVGSIDVDLALDADKLNDGRYAEILKLLLDTRRYNRGPKTFQLITTVDLHDGEPPVQVIVDFLAPREMKLEKNKPKLVQGFRVQQADGCANAFHAPVEYEITGANTEGVGNSVTLLIASIPDSLIMKAYAIARRDKPKDVYDLCYELAEYPDGLEKLAGKWKQRSNEKDVITAVGILRDKFRSVDWHGPGQFVAFHNSANPEERKMQARYAYELVQRFLSLLEQSFPSSPER